MQRMASTCARMLCILLATLLIGGCAHRLKVTAPPAVGAAAKSAGASASAGKEMRDAIKKLRESLRHNKPDTAAHEQVSAPAVHDPEPQSGAQAVGTSGKWVVTTTTERADPQVTSSTTRTVQRSRAQLAVVSRAIRRGWPMLVAGLALVCLVALMRSMRHRAENS
jgi:hypothetical protein